ncbi:hypothetical protein H072_5065 [Dactylellina haptotyla CBS 200.50]|uniref:Uncharacterized protein n=1 Tax=Dactylellina haptotyla (strain CBS 200.50) TaxID=1284197 RepID=S8AIR1_DACHA|nr:hypothetical protein H072_5065 [Dactylellina haptotyla CBS 200.50]
MSEPLADISPNKVYGISQISSSQPPLEDPISLSEDSEYSVIEYNLQQTFSSSRIGEKHLRSVNNSPIKVMKKPKYDDSGKENQEISFADDDEDDFLTRITNKLAAKEEELTAHSFDANLSGFSEALENDGVGISRETEEQLGEKSVDRQILRESYRRERSMDRSSAMNTPTKTNFSISTPNRHSWSSPKSDPVTPGTVTPRANGAPSRLANLSQYSKSPESTPGNPERTQNLLLDFTAQFNAIKSFPPPQTPSRSRRRSNSASPTKRTRDTESPSKQPLPAVKPLERKFLLDFDIPPPPTPRSIPSITPKEVENLRGQYLAQIAQIKAELAGKDAQLQTLKDAVSDAERRASNGIVELRQVREEMEDMSARSLLIESKLTEAGRAVRELQEQIEEGNKQIDEARSERDSLKSERDSHKKEVDELRRENEEVSESLLKTKQDLASAKKDLIVERQKRSSAPNSPSRGQTNGGADVEAAVEKAVAAANATKDMEISQAVEKVAKELHTLYKSKHEQKVTALKQSYSKRWEKRVNELEAKNSELNTVNNELNNKIMRIEEENEERLNLSAPLISPQKSGSHQKEEIDKLEKKVAKAHEEIQSLQDELALERQEKSELVLAVDELLALGGAPGVAENGMGSLRGSVSRASGVGIARGLSPVKSEKETKSSSGLRGGIERMGGGANPPKGRFGFPPSH